MLLYEKNNNFCFFHNLFCPCSFSPIAIANNEQHNLENKDLENNGLEGQLHFSCSKHCLYNIVNSNGFDVSTWCITYGMGILPLPNCVNGTYEYIAIWTNKHYVQPWTPCNVVPTMKTNGCSIIVNQVLCPFNYLFEPSTLNCFNKSMQNPWYDGGL